MAIRNHPAASLLQADAHKVPLASSHFDLCICHFFLLWVSDPSSVVREMARITRPGGIVCALAEPDYGGRIDFPPDLTTLGQYQSQALSQQGANPELGRQLRSLFTRAGLRDVVTGVLGGQWRQPFDPDEWESEWQVLQNDLAQLTDVHETLKKQKAQDLSAWVKGERILYVPTFYAWGRVAG
jgi:ubiquinone/menaquinone biosynthesis C-methylase UbiE